MEQALAAHDVDTKLVGMVVGPTVTRYELELAAGVKVSRITSLSKDIAYAMASPDVRILAPIPGRQAIGVEVPNRDRQVVSLGGILASAEARKATHPLEVAIGRDINAKPVMMDLSRMPHILIAGATGAGKSSCINSMITSVLMRSTPDQVRMILVDPKMVEMAQYEHVPHLLTQPVTDPKKAANALAWACREMDRRYEILASVGVRDIDGYNDACDQGVFETDRKLGIEDSEPKERMPLILVVVDELADLMMGGPSRRGGFHLPDRPEGPGGGNPSGDRHPAAVHQRDHRRDQGQHPGPAGLRRVEPNRQPGDPRPAGG